MYIELFVVGLVGYALFKVVARGFYTVKPDERAVITSFGRAERLGDAMVEDDSMDSTESAGLAQCVQQPAPRGEVCEALPATVQAAITAPGHGARGAANGFAISLASEWIANPEGDYEKQDCERKAFVRLAAKLKQFHPRLPICLTADGLYPYQGFFDICRANAWTFILTFKDGNLPTVWQEVQALRAFGPARERHERRTLGGKRIEQTFHWINDIDYRGHRLQWLECLETVNHLESAEQTDGRFVHLTDLEVSADTVAMLSATGRLRWKIENEGFNTQKNLGYALQHKYARVNWQAAKNYYQCLQIGHLINQLMVLSTTFEPLLPGKITLRHLWHTMIAFLLHGRLRRSTLDALAERRFQVRFT